MASSPVVPMYAPDGTLGDIPYDQMSAALRAGGKLGVHMKAPDGTEGVVPAERVQDAAKAGGKIIPFDLSEAKPERGTWQTFKDDITSIFSGMNTDESWRKGKVGAAVAEREEAKQVAESRKTAGYDLAYRTAAPVAEAFGTNVQGMEQAAKEGYSDAVIGHMLAGQALATAPLATEGLLKGGGAVVRSAETAKNAIGTALRTETGALKPAVKATSSLAKLFGGPEIAEAVIPDRPGAATMAERRAVPVSKSPTPGGYKGPPKEAKITPQVPQIVPPEAGAPTVQVSEGRPATWTNERVIQLAASGDRNAIAQAVRRGFMLPENARYVMGDMDYPSAVHNPKSVTKFTPTGEPIVQSESDFAFRSRDVGENGIPADPRSHAHATADLDELQRLAPGRESITGKPQEFVKVDLSKMEEGKDFARMHRPGQSDWIRFLRPLDEGEIEKLPGPVAPTTPKSHRFSNSAKTRQEIQDMANKLRSREQ